MNWIDFNGGAIIGVLAGVFGGLCVLIYGLLQKTKLCPQCGAKQPKVRKPANRQQMLWGGWTCLECKCEIDRKGNKVKPKDS